MAACGRTAADTARRGVSLVHRSDRARAGTTLVTEAVVRATRLQRVAVLLVDPDSPARDFYLRRGWQTVGTATHRWGHRTVEAALHVPPDVQVQHRGP